MQEHHRVHAQTSVLTVDYLFHYEAAYEGKVSSHIYFYSEGLEKDVVRERVVKMFIAFSVFA